MINEEKVFYPTYNDLKLCGVINKTNENDEIVVICHARTSSKDSRPTMRLAEELSKNNINNFRFDFIACGESDGDYTEYTVSNMIRNLQDTLDAISSTVENITSNLEIINNDISLIKGSVQNLENRVQALETPSEETPVEPSEPTEEPTEQEP